MVVEDIIVIKNIIMKKKIILICSIIMITIVGCDNKTDDLILDNTKATAQAEVSFSKIINEVNLGNKYNALGYAYDCTLSDFKGSENINLGAVINVSKYLAGEGIDPLAETVVKRDSGKILMANFHSDTSNGEVCEGRNVEEYINNLNRDVPTNVNTIDKDRLTLFSGKIKKMFDDSLRYTSNYAFITYQRKNIKQEFVFVNADPEYLKYFLTDQFRHDIKVLTGEELVEKYGTHVLTDINIGNSMEVTFNGWVNSSDEYSLFKQNAEKNYSQMQFTPHTPIDSCRFDAINNAAIHVTDMSDDNQIMGIGNNAKTYPLSAFISDPAKRKLVEEAIESYILSSQLKNYSLEKESLLNTDITLVNNFSKQYLVARKNSLSLVAHLQDGKKLRLIPHGHYYLIGCEDSNMYLDSSRKFSRYNENGSQLWMINFTGTKGSKIVIGNFKENFYLGTDLSFNYRYESYNSGLFWTVQ